MYKRREENYQIKLNSNTTPPINVSRDKKGGRAWKNNIRQKT
jgi:hypothetical protein